MTQGKMIGIYDIKALLGVGSTAMVLLAEDLKLKDVANRNAEVALKLVWHRERAEDEAGRLAAVRGLPGVCSLLGVQVTSGMAIQGVIAPFVAMIEKDCGLQINLNDAQEIVILVFPHVPGEPLLRTGPFEGNSQPYERTVTIVQGGLEYTIKESPAASLWRLPASRRASVLLGLARTLYGVHQRDVVHGDLKPENLLWHAATETVTLIDFGSFNQFGSAGWQSPEHEASDQDPIELTPYADCYAFGHYLRMIGWDVPGCQALADGCQSGEINLEEVIEFLEARFSLA